MSDGHSKSLPPQAPALDEIILGDDEPMVSVSPARPTASLRIQGAAKESRESSGSEPRISLPPRMPSVPPAPLAADKPQATQPTAAPIIKPMRIIAVGPANAERESEQSGKVQKPAVEPPPRMALGIDAQEDSWTPYQPPYQPPPNQPNQIANEATILPPAPPVPLAAPAVHTSVAEASAAEASMAPASSDDIPIDVASEDEVTRPERLDGSEEIEIDDDEAKSGGAVGNVASEVDEVDVDDLVSIDPTPAPTAVAVQSVSPLIPMLQATQAEHAEHTGDLIAPPPMNEATASRKKSRPWWEELFNDDFIRTMAMITDRDIAREVDFIEESLGCETGATILDLACGTGRHSIELAARGYKVVGFDLSLAMLARASDEAQERKQKINFVQGDMRDMAFDETFDGIFAWNTSFGYFDDEKNNAVIAKVHKALKKGGQFLLDVINRDFVVRQAPSIAWFEGDGCICMDEMAVDFITSRLKVKRTLMLDTGRAKVTEYTIRVYALNELGKMLNDNGFRVAEVSGRMSTPGVFFGCESPRTLILAEKR
ncbi:MAG: methyltransferase domain-containing protein [Polyangiaceae bacterium]|nr:methyltransferase domain-containing protein [Polyangiaceae bacterium]